MHLIRERLFLLTDTRTYPSLLILWRGLTTSAHLLTFTASAYPPASPVGSPSSTTGFPFSRFLLPDLLYLCGSPFFTKASLLPHRLPRSLTKVNLKKEKKKKLKNTHILVRIFKNDFMWCEQKHSLYACTGMCAEILTVSEVLSSRKLMALFTSSLQSWRATMHSSWVFPVTSISWEWAKKYFKIDPHLIQWKQ